MVIWTYNSGPLLIAPPNEVITNGDTTTLLIRNPQQSDAGTYQCTFKGLNLQAIVQLGELTIPCGIINCTCILNFMWLLYK